MDTAETISARHLADAPIEMVIPWFLRDAHVTDPTWEGLLAAACVWLRSLGLGTSTLERARDFRLGTDSTGLLQRTIAELYFEGFLTTGQPNQQQVSVPFDDDGLMVSHEAICQAYRTTGYALPALHELPDPCRLSHAYLRECRPSL